MKLRNVFIRSNKPSVFQSVMMSAIEFGGTGCDFLELNRTEGFFVITAFNIKSESAIKTAMYNMNDVAELYGDHYNG